jgi:hypothetical protein
MNYVTQTTEPLAHETLGVSPDSNSGVTTSCEECGKPFVPATPRQRFCGNACRQTAHRKSPAHRDYLDRQKLRRISRRNGWFARRNRDRSISPISAVYSGPSVDSVPRLGSLPLPEMPESDCANTLSSPSDPDFQRTTTAAIHLNEGTVNGND